MTQPCVLWFLARERVRRGVAAAVDAEPVLGQDAVSYCTGRESRGRGEAAQSVQTLREFYLR